MQITFNKIWTIWKRSNKYLEFSAYYLMIQALQGYAPFATNIHTTPAFSSPKTDAETHVGSYQSQQNSRAVNIKIFIIADAIG